MYGCDAVVAVLDGPDVDSGTCIELGMAHALGKKIIGVRTDFRGLEVDGLNIMIRHILDSYLYWPGKEVTVEEIASAIHQELEKHLDR